MLKRRRYKVFLFCSIVFALIINTSLIFAGNYTDSNPNKNSYYGRVSALDYIDTYATEQYTYPNLFSSFTYPYRSTSWTGADQFRSHWANINNIGYNRTYIYTIYTVNTFLQNFENIRSNIGWGDIIQHAHSNGDTYHSQTVSRTGVPHGGFYDIKVAQHSSPQLTRSLYDMLTEKQNYGLGSDYVFVYKIKNSIY